MRGNGFLPRDCGGGGADRRDVGAANLLTGNPQKHLAPVLLLLLCRRCGLDVASGQRRVVVFLAGGANRREEEIVNALVEAEFVSFNTLYDIDR
ncbi:hypothetical protein AGMMS49960_18140 [Betaproteobacteria bacterium]|nr:hypothetical protein AGMMS49960_18140 [Betaproteobacteria bacterium]